MGIKDTFTPQVNTLMNSVITRNNVKISGQANGPVVMLAHGFGCDQNMWRFMQKELERD
jgi:sigma-B regulation protein RsbQ